MKLLLIGGGTLGSVTPLLAVGQDLLEQKAEHEVRFWGTLNGPEGAVVKKTGIEFTVLRSGKFRRYWSWKNLLAPFQTMLGFFQACRRLGQWHPDLIMVAGSFVSVPAVWAAWWRKIPVIVHQQDVSIGLANKLMFPAAKVITAVFDNASRDLPRRAIITGNPVRQEFLQAWPQSRVEEIKQRLGLNDEQPVLLVLGGSSGAAGLNKLVIETLPKLRGFCQVVHVTGKGKDLLVGQHENYVAVSFVDNAESMAELLATADLVISRAGMGIISELAALAKPAVLVPLPNTHQELNVQELVKRGAVVGIDQTNITLEQFVKNISNLLTNSAQLEVLQERIVNALRTISGNDYFEKIKSKLAAKK